MQRELKPCPFCGNPAEMATENYVQCSLDCFEDCIHIDTWNARVQAQKRQARNMRIDESALVEVAEDLVREIYNAKPIFNDEMPRGLSIEFVKKLYRLFDYFKMGDASTRKDEEGIADAAFAKSPASPSKISVIDESDIKDVIDNALVKAMNIDCSLVESVYNAILPYLRTTEPDEVENSDQIYERLSKRAKIIGMKLCPIEPVSVSDIAAKMKDIEQGCEFEVVIKNVLDAVGIAYVD